MAAYREHDTSPDEESPAGYTERMKSRIRRNLRDPEQRSGTILILALAGFMVLFLVYWVVLVLQLPTARDLKNARVEEASIAYTADGVELTRFYTENRSWIPLDSISQNVTDALIATEDVRFYQHWGIDLRRTIGAIFKTAAGDVQGGSTITMQLARNAFSDIQDDIPITRKFKEWITAVRIESMYEKDEILEMYLNTMPFLYNAYGIEAAARTYFQKSAYDLDLLESATLVGMLKGTAYYNPRRHPERSHERRNVVLQQMMEHGYITEAEYEEVKDQETQLNFRHITHEDNLAPHFAEYIRQWIGEWAEQRGYNLYRDGLRIYTTIDSKMQQAANEAARKMGEQFQAVGDVEWSAPRSPYFSSNAADYLSFRRNVDPFAYYWQVNPERLDDFIKQTERYRTAVRAGLPPDSAIARLHADEAFVDSVKKEASRLEVGFLAMDPHTGHVKAWVGGRDFSGDQYDHVALSKRQAGSAFKPFVYAAALESGYSPNHQLQDQVFEYVDPDTKRRWRPENVGKATGQPMTLRDALAYSKNTITAQLVMEIGPDRVADFAHRVGIQSELDAVPSIGLGTSDVSLLEMVTAYSTLANGGNLVEPLFVTRIEDRHGNVIGSFSTQIKEVISSQTAYSIVDMMRGVVQYGTGQRIRSFRANGDFAAKTGTTQNGADGWFMLMHPTLVMGSWVGFESPAIPFRSSYWGQGSHNALYIVGNFLQGVELPDGTFNEPPGYHVAEAATHDSMRYGGSYYDEHYLDSLMARADSLTGDSWSEDRWDWSFDEDTGWNNPFDQEDEQNSGFDDLPMTPEDRSAGGNGDSVTGGDAPVRGQDAGVSGEEAGTEPDVPEEELPEVDRLNRQERENGPVVE